MSQLMINAIEYGQEFYISEKNKLIVAVLEEKCYIIICIDPICDCSQTQKCDLEFGTSIKTLYSDIQEITKEYFIKLYQGCKALK